MALTSDSFQIKDFVSITASMLNLLRASQKKLTDFNVGAIARTALEASAAEIEELYQQMFNGLVQAIPVSVYNSFNFSKLMARAASGTVTVNIIVQGSDTVISQGTTFTAETTSETYALEADVIIPAGQTTANVTVVCNDTGLVGNLGADTGFDISPAPTGFTGASNPNAFINGIDDESPEDQLIRFNGYITTLQRATTDAIVYGAETTVLTDANGNAIEVVATAVVVEPYFADNTKTISNIFCYVHNGVGGTSPQLVSQAQQVINGYTDANGKRVPGYKAAGVVCTAVAATEQALAVTGVLTAKSGYDKPTLVGKALTVLSALLLQLAVGATAKFSQIETLVCLIPGVDDFVITTPTANVVAAAPQNKIIPGALTVT